MSSKKNGDEQGNGIEIDFEAFENQLDQEIDSLFVPLGSPRSEGDQPSVSSKKEDDPPSDVGDAEVARMGPDTLAVGQSHNDEVKLELKIEALDVGSGTDTKTGSPSVVSNATPVEADDESSIQTADEPQPSVREGSEAFIGSLNASTVSSEIDGDQPTIELEPQVDEEDAGQDIGSLFVASDGSVAEEDQSPPLIIEGQALPPGVEDTDAGQASEEQGKMEIDFEEFETKIDREIDTLFVPYDESSVKSEPPSAKMPASGQEVPDSRSEGPSSTLGSETITMQEPELADLDVTADEPSATVDDRTELASSLESFYTAYLSLDWEFSVDNVSRFYKSLGRLEKYSHKCSETHSLFKILKTILQRLQKKPDSFSQQVAEIVRDSQDLLKTLLASETGPGALEKERFKYLVARFKSLGDRKIVEKKREPPISGSVPSRPSPKQFAPARMPPKEAAGFDWQPLTELSEWMEDFCSSFEASVRSFDRERNNLARLEGVLSKTPALEPVTSRLGIIRSNMDEHILAISDRKEELSGRLEWLGELESKLSEHLSDPHRKSGAPVMADSVPAQPATPSVSPNMPKPAPVSDPEHICLFSMAGHRLALLASNVVKIEHVSPRKAKKILDRGYATLADFKPFLRSLKTGLFGVWWTGIPIKILSGYQFLPLSHTELRAPEPPSVIAGAILVSNGQNHGLILTESAELNLHNEVISRAHEGEGLLGTIQDESGQAIEVLDINRILRKQNRIG